MRRGLAVFLILVAASAVVLLRTARISPFGLQARSPDSGSQTYTSESYGLSLQYPGTFRVVDLGAGEILPPEAIGYIPACDRDANLCVYYAGDELQGSNFESAGVGVTIHASDDAQAVCERQDENLPVAGERSSLEIDGVTFEKVRAGDAGMGHVAEAYRYWTFSGGRCLVVEARIGYAQFEHFEPGAVEEFTDRQRAALRDTLEGIVTTLEFSR